MLVGFLAISLVPLFIIAAIALSFTKSALSDRAFSQLDNVRNVKTQQVISYIHERKIDLGMLLKAVSGLKKAAFDKLKAAQENKKAQISFYFKEIAKDIEVISGSRIIIEAISDFESTIDKNGRLDVLLYEFYLNEKYGGSLFKLSDIYGYHNLLLIAADGKVIYSNRKDIRLGKKIFQSPLKKNGLARCFETAKQRLSYQDFEPFGPENQYIAFMGHPIKDREGHLKGVLILALTTQAIDEIAHRREGMGKTGETYLAVRQGNGLFLRSRRDVSQGNIGDRLPRSVDSLVTPGTTAPVIKVNAKGVPEISVYDILDVYEEKYVLFTHMALKEVIDPWAGEKEKNYFVDYLNAYNYENLYLISKDGFLLFSALETGEPIDQSLSVSHSGLGRLYQRITATHSEELVDFSLRAGEKVPYAFIGAPLLGPGGHIEMMVALKMSSKGLNKIMMASKKAGKTLDIYLVGPDHLMRSDSYSLPKTFSVEQSFLAPKQHEINTTAVESALKGETGKSVLVGYRNKDVFSSYSPLDIMGHTWAVIAEIDKDEALKTLPMMVVLISISGIAAAISIFFLSLYLSSRFASPIKNLTSAVEKIRAGNFDAQVETGSDDEFGTLADAFNSMTYTIKEYAWNLETKVNQLQKAEVEIRKSEERFRALVETTSDWIWEVNEKGVYTYVSPRIKHVLGYEPEEVLGKTPFDLMIDADKDRLTEVFGAIVASKQPFSSLENTNRHKDGRFLVLETSGVPFFNEQGALMGYRGVDRDITRRKESEEALLLTESVFTNTIEGIAITDREGQIQRVNQAFCDITGYSQKEAVGQNPRILKSDRHDADFYEEMWKKLLDEGQWSGEIWNRRKDGSAYPEWLSISAIKDRSGQITNFVSLFHDISEKKNKEEQLQFLAFHDPLTHLPNRTLLYDRIKVALRSAKRNQKKLALLYMDIDNFKNINDSYGHPFGDEFLCRVKDRIKSICRESDTFARYGGDEFVIVLHNIEENQQAIDFSDRIISLFKTPLFIFDEEIYSSVSIGLSIFPDDGQDIVTLEKNADMALYEAKKFGKQQAFLFKHTLKDKMLRKTHLENAMRRAVNDFDSFFVLYQPKVSVVDRKILGVEALLRWQVDDEPVSPMEFISIAEETNLIIPIGEWLIEKGTTQFRQIHDLGFPEISLSINLSANQFNADDFIDRVKTILNKTKFNPSRLCFEITESIPVTNTKHAIETMQQLNALGIKLSMDDFGTGYSSLSVLKQFPLHELKIDRSFVKDLPGNTNDAAISRTIIQMAKSLNFQVVAEGVETDAQLDFMVENGCHMIQGFYFYKPLSYVDMQKVLKIEESATDRV